METGAPFFWTVGVGVGAGVSLASAVGDGLGEGVGASASDGVGETLGRFFEGVGDSSGVGVGETFLRGFGEADGVKLGVCAAAARGEPFGLTFADDVGDGDGFFFVADVVL